MQFRFSIIEELYFRRFHSNRLIAIFTQLHRSPKSNVNSIFCGLRSKKINVCQNAIHLYVKCIRFIKENMASHHVRDQKKMRCALNFH